MEQDPQLDPCRGNTVSRHRSHAGVMEAGTLFMKIKGERGWVSRLPGRPARLLDRSVVLVGLGVGIVQLPDPEDEGQYETEEGQESDDPEYYVHEHEHDTLAYLPQIYVTETSPKEGKHGCYARVLQWYRRIHRLPEWLRSICWRCLVGLVRRHGIPTALTELRTGGRVLSAVWTEHVNSSVLGE